MCEWQGWNEEFFWDLGVGGCYWFPNSDSNYFEKVSICRPYAHPAVRLYITNKVINEQTSSFNAQKK